MNSKKSFFRSSKGLLSIALVLILVGSFFAGMFNSSFYSVNVKEIKFEAEHGTLTGLLYMPKEAGANDPRPVIVTTHGYLNSKEMQDAPAIEMSRRGYIVLALDMYDHGDSLWKDPIPAEGIFGTFWVHSQFDAVKYIYNQEFTKKDENGNGYIAVSGHSMGGFSSFAAMYFDEMNALQTGYRMIHAGISVGSDFMYLAGIAPQDQVQAAFGSRTVGMVAGQYDEFFFNKSPEEKSAAEQEVKGTVVKKDYLSTISGKSFLGLSADAEVGNEGQFYNAESGDVKIEDKIIRESQQGQRVIFTPGETHPWNHFSKTTATHLIDFYDVVFKDVVSPNQTNAHLSSNQQIWWFKEAFSFIAMIGFFLLIVPLTNLLLQLPFLNRSITKEVGLVAAPATTSQKVFHWLAIAFSVFIPGVLFVTLIAKLPEQIKTMSIIALALLSIFVVVFIVSLVKGKGSLSNWKHVRLGSAILAVVSLIMWAIFQYSTKIYPLGSYFNAPTVNQVLYWALASAGISLILVIAFHYFTKKNAGTVFSSYGISSNLTSVVASLVTAIATVTISYMLLFLMESIFGTDFRFWTMAVRTFQYEHFVTALKFIPFFFIFYFINTITLNANTRGQRFGYLLSILLNVGGLVLWVALQYGKLFATGVALYPQQSLNAILLFALIPCLLLAAIYARKLFERTNNVWLGAFINTILFTIITVSGTALFWNIV